MKYKLYKDTISEYSALQQILYNRGIPIDEQQHWINAGWDDIFPWQELAEDKMKQACSIVADCIQDNSNVQIVVDSDDDGWTSAAILLNYFYDRFPDWAEDHLSYLTHVGKEHGLSDIIDKIDCDVLISPDGGTNDWNEHQQLEQSGIKCLVLDHHTCNDIELIDSSPAIIINVQLEDYPNKALTGAGVSYKFISAFEDIIVHGEQPTELMDLCALGNCGDMADYRELEIRAIMNVGLSNITNPFFFNMAKKNDFSIQKMNGINYFSVAFYVVPFINALVRSGTEEEKDMVFKAMLTRYAFDDVESSKRGEKGKLVPRYEEAVTVAERVKRRQTKLQDESMELLEKKIEEENLLDNAIILCLCKPGEVEKNIAGLCANKLQAKYQKPAAILTYSKTIEDDEPYYRGSMRNYSLSPIQNLKDEVEKTGEIEFCAGHQGAFGSGVALSHVGKFLEKFNEQYKDVDQTPTYWVDYIWNSRTIDSNKILDIGELNIYGQEIPESLVVVEDICLRPDMITLMSPDKHPTLKIQIGNISAIKFKSSQEEYEEFCGEDKVLTIVGKCAVNEWNGKVTPQILVEDMSLREEWIF